MVCSFGFLIRFEFFREFRKNNFLEYECCREVWHELVDEASCTIAIHKAIAADISENCVQETKQFKAETWKKGMFGPSTQQSTFQKQYKQAQSS